MTEVAQKTDEKALTEGQEAFLKMCEEKFANRYTETDEDYMKLYNENMSTPPIIPNWYDRNRGFRSNNRPRNNYHNRGYDNSNYNRGYDNSSYNRGYNNYDRGYNNYNDGGGYKRRYDDRR